MGAGPDPPPDPMGDEDWAARAAFAGEEREPADPELEDDLAGAGSAWYAGVAMTEILAGGREISVSEARAEALAEGGRLGSMPPDECEDAVAALAHRGALDEAVPCGTLVLFAEDAAGPGRNYAGASADEVMGAVRLWDRIVSYAMAQRYAATAAFIRHRPAEGCEAAEPGGMPRVWEEFTATEMAHSLADSRYAAETLLDTGHDLEVKLPGTFAALLIGDIRDDKARIIARATANLDPEEAREAEARVLGRAGTLTPGGLRAAIARAVIEIAPDKARKRREEAARTRRVEVRPEESGNAQVAVRELAADLAAAIDQELSARARELKKYGIGTDTGDRRVLALLERFGLAGPLPGSADAGASAGSGRVALAGRLNLTVTVETMQGLRDRPGELSGYGPIDPDLARRLGEAALAHPGSRVCVTVTDQGGQMTGHGCARPPTRDERRRYGLRGPPGDGLSLRPAPGQDRGQRNSGRETWVLAPGQGRPELIVMIWPVTTDPCDHRMEAAGHDPGTELRHVTNLRYGTCTGPVCRRPAARLDFEHNRPYEHDGKTCLCNGNPKCRFEHRLKQDPRWRVNQRPDGCIEWIAPTGRKAVTAPHLFPV